MWRRILSTIFGRWSDGRTRWYAVKLLRERDAVHHGWLVDPASQAYSSDFGASVWFDSIDEAVFALEANGLSIYDHGLVELRIRLDSNHYRMTDVGWF